MTIKTHNIVICWLTTYMLLGLPGYSLATDADKSSSPLLDPAYKPHDDPKEVHWYSGSRAFVGVSVKSVTFTVMDKDTLKKRGALAESMHISPSIHFETPYYSFSDDPASKAGWYVELGYSSFKVTEQEIGSDDSGGLVDMGTAVEGEYLYLTPVVFYNFGDLNIKPGCGLSLARKGACGESFKFGIGYGIGYLQARGNMVLTEVTGQPTVNINTDKIGYAIAVLMEYRLNNWMIRARGNFPTTDGNLPNTEHELYEFVMDIGLAINF